MNEIDNSDIIMITDDGVIAEMIIEVDSGSESLERESFLADAMNEECMDFVTSNFNSASNYANECPNSNADENIRVEDNADALISRPVIETYLKSEVPDDDFVEFIAEVKSEDCSINTQPKHDPTKRKKRKYVRRNQLVSTNRGRNKILKPLQKQVRLGCGEKLGNIPYIYRQVQKSQQHILMPFYRTLYFSSPSADIDVVKNKILAFNGFPFDKTSLEFSRRKQVMKLLCHQTVEDICLLLGIIFGIKSVMISNILKFLLKPEKELDPLLDICLQPVVRLTKLTEEFIASKVVAKKAPNSTSTRKINKHKLKRMQRTYEAVRKLRSYNKVESLREKKPEVPQSPVEKSKEISDIQDTATSIAESEGEEKNFPDLLQDTILEIENFENTELGNLRTEESPLDSEYCKKNTNTQRRKRGRPKFVIRGCGEMLRKFPEIKENICKAQQTVLQRLHILLFGKLDDKPRKLKENILKFSGFSFKPKSVRWLRKEFILSLMPLDKLIEIRDVLDLFCNDCKQYNLIASIMKFLQKPEKSLLNSSACNARNIKGKKKSRTTSGKQGKSAKKKMRIKGNKRKKILMSEEELNKLMKMDGTAETWNEDINICESSDDLKASVKKRVYRSLKALSREEPSVAENHSEITTMLQIIHERRAQKEEAASTPMPQGGCYAIYGHPKGKGVKLGMIPNVQFMVVTSNYDDLDDLHQLIFMHAAVRSKIRRKILEFNGFHFDENSPYYEVRKLLLEKMGYEVSKRLAFFLGLTPLSTKIPQEDLNDLIMYFLMSPRHIKSVPIRNFPKNFFNTVSPRQRPIVELSFKEEPESVKPENEVEPKVSKEKKEKCKKVSTRANIIKIDIPSTTASTALLSEEQEDGTESYDSSATDLLNPSYNNEATNSGNCTEQNTYVDRKNNKRDYESERVPPTFNLKNMKFVDRSEIKIKLPIGKSSYSGRVSLVKSSTSDENVSSTSQSCAVRRDKISTNNTSTENTESSESDAPLSESSGSHGRFKKLKNESRLKKDSYDKSMASLPRSRTLNSKDNLIKVSISSDASRVSSASSICSDTPAEQNSVLYKYMLKLEPSPGKTSSNVDTKKASGNITSFVKILPAMPRNESKSVPTIQNNITNQFPVSTKQLIPQSSVMPDAERECVNLIILTAGPPQLLSSNSLQTVTFSDAVSKERDSSESIANEDNLTETDPLPCDMREQSNDDTPQALEDDSSKNSDSLKLSFEQTEINDLPQSLCEVIINCDENSSTPTALIDDSPLISERPFHIAVTKTS